MKHTDPAAHHYTPEELHNEDVAHEHTDINIRAIVTFGVSLAVIVIAVAALMYGLFRWLDRSAESRDAQVSPLAAPAAQMPPTTVQSPVFGTAPQPQLLTNEYAYLARQRQAEEQRLTSYGWVDEQAGVARLPIEQAKKLLLERGVPAREGAPADATLGTVRPSRGEASSGRTVDGPPRGAGLPAVGGASAPQAQPPQKDGH